MGTLGAPCSSSSERFHASQKGCEAGGSAVPSGSSYLTAAAGTTAGQGMCGRCGVFLWRMAGLCLREDHCAIVLSGTV